MFDLVATGTKTLCGSASSTWHVTALPRSLSAPPDCSVFPRTRAHSVYSFLVKPLLPTTSEPPLHPQTKIGSKAQLRAWPPCASRRPARPLMRSVLALGARGPRSEMRSNMPAVVFGEEPQGRGWRGGDGTVAFTTGGSGCGCR